MAYLELPVNQQVVVSADGGGGLHVGCQTQAVVWQRGANCGHAARELRTDQQSPTDAFRCGAQLFGGQWHHLCLAPVRQGQTLHSACREAGEALSSVVLLPAYSSAFLLETAFSRRISLMIKRGASFIRLSDRVEQNQLQKPDHTRCMHRLGQAVDLTMELTQFADGFICQDHELRDKNGGRGLVCIVPLY